MNYRDEFEKILKTTMVNRMISQEYFSYVPLLNFYTSCYYLLFLSVIDMWLKELVQCLIMRSIIQINRFTSGLLFSTVTYIGMLNGYVSDINEYLISLQDLKETVYRLKGENNNELQYFLCIP